MAACFWGSLRSDFRAYPKSATRVLSFECLHKDLHLVASGASCREWGHGALEPSLAGPGHLSLRLQPQACNMQPTTSCRLCFVFVCLAIQAASPRAASVPRSRLGFEPLLASTFQYFSGCGWLRFHHVTSCHIRSGFSKEMWGATALRAQGQG